MFRVLRNRIAMGWHGYAFPSFAFVRIADSLQLNSNLHVTGQALLQFPVFSKTVEKCNTILKTHEMYIIEMLTSKRKNIFNDILNSLVCITVMQVINCSL